MGLLRLRNTIIACLEQGMSREEVFNHQVKLAPGEAGKIAFAIASVPREELHRKYLKLNSLLFLCLICAAISGGFLEFLIDTEQSTMFIALRIAIPLVLCYFVYHLHGGIYRLLFLWCLFDLSELVVMGKFAALIGLIKLLSLTIAVILSIYIALKVFPHLNFLGPKRDNLGRYFL